MPSFNEVVSWEEKYILRKKIRMMDIMRGVYYFAGYGFSWDRYAGRGVVTQHVLSDRVRLVHCYNYNKYALFAQDYIKLYIVIIDGEPIGIACLNSSTVCKFIPNEKYKCWDEAKLCEILKQELEGTTFHYSYLNSEDKSLWIRKYSQELFALHLKFEDDFIAQLWRKMSSRIEKQQLMEYRDVIYEKRNTFSPVQKEMIAQEIVFYILPQYISKCSDEERAVVNELCRFVMDEYKISIESEGDICQVLSQLEEPFLVNSLEKAKEYYIENECSTEQYKDCCMNVAYNKIMDSFEKWDISSYQTQWKREAIERALVCEGIEKDWNIERVLDLTVELNVEASVLTKLKKYISEHIEEIYVREALIFHMQDIMLNNINHCLITDIIKECCDMLQGFESRELSLAEKETLRKAQNNREISYEKFNYINKKKKVVVIENYIRIRPARDKYAPRDEWSPTGKEPYIFLLWDTEGLIGKLEVVEHHIIWNMIGEDREKLFRLFSEFVRNLEIIPPEKEIRYATKEEAEYWDEKAILSCIENENFFQTHSEWFICTGHSLDIRLIKGILRELKKYEKIRWMHKSILTTLIFFVLPNIEKNPELCTQQDLQAIRDFMETATNIKFQEKGVSGSISPSDLIDNYYDCCRVNTLSAVKEMYLYSNCQKSQYSDGEVLYYPKLWEEFKQFDITAYEKKWLQEEFDKVIEKAKMEDDRRFALSPYFILDLLEREGTLDNYRRFISVYEKFWNKQYILFRLEKIMKQVTEEKIYYLLDDFCNKLKKEISVEEN